MGDVNLARTWDPKLLKDKKAHLMVSESKKSQNFFKIFLKKFFLRVLPEKGSFLQARTQPNSWGVAHLIFFDILWILDINCVFQESVAIL